MAVAEEVLAVRRLTNNSPEAEARRARERKKYEIQRKLALLLALPTSCGVVTLLGLLFSKF